MFVLWSSIQVQFKTNSHVKSPFPLPAWHLLSSFSFDTFPLPTLCITPFLPSGQTPCGLDAVCFAPSIKAQWICRLMAIVLPYWSLTGHIEAQQDFKRTKAVYCIVLSSKWRSPSSYREQSLEMSAERRHVGEEVKGEWLIINTPIQLFRNCFTPCQFLQWR